MSEDLSTYYNPNSSVGWASPNPIMNDTPDCLYFDEFAKTYSLEKDANAPPERYTVIFPGGAPGLYIETWAVDSNKRISIAYSKYRYYNDYWHNLEIEYNKKKYKLTRLLYITLPPDDFNEKVNSIFNQKEEKKDEI